MKRSAILALLAIGVAVSPAAAAQVGNLFASLSPVGEVHQYSPEGADLGTFLKGGFGGLQYPTGIAFGRDGNLYVGEFINNRIRKFSPTGVDLGVFVSTGLNHPQEIRFDAIGNLFVANIDDHAIRKFSPTGVDLGKFAAVYAPHHIAIDHDGNLYVVGGTLGGSTITKFDSTGAYLREFTTSGTTGDSLGGIAIGPNGTLFVGQRFGQIIEMSPNLENLGTFVTADSGPIQDLCFDSDGNLFVAKGEENRDGRIRKFSPTGQDLGVIAETARESPLFLAFAPIAVPEPRAIVIAMLGFTFIVICSSARRRSCVIPVDRATD